MKKMNLHSPDWVSENIRKLAEIFPNCVTEALGSDGTIKHAIDYDQLRQELSDHIVDGPQERYHLNWPGKREALLAANAPIAKTLRPARGESVDFDKTQNLFIEGDNLEALKLLQETYLGKVKMIYIDPPYNTGNDFIYEDDFAENTDEFLERSNQKDKNGNRLVANPDSKGRFHSDWLSMMYSRLRLAKNLLQDDGAIFINIDDNEIHNIRNLCNEIFGDNNFFCQFSWRRTDNQSNIGNFARVKEYIVFYAKNRQLVQLGKLPLSEKAKAEYAYSDAEGKFRRRNILDKSRGKRRYEIIAPDGTKLNGPWMLDLDEFNKLNEKGAIYWASGKMPYGKKYLHEASGQIISDWLDKDFGTNQRGSQEIDLLFGARVFDFPKPTQLIKTFIKILTTEKSIILDFFAGSATTAHAVMQLNADDGGNRKFIMVQWPEACDPKSEAAKAGYSNIAEISKERIRRAGTKILDGECHQDWNKDIGFRVLKVDTSNMKDVYYRPDEVDQSDLLSLVDNIKPDRTGEDLLFQVLVDWGVDLTLPIRHEEIDGKSVYFVDEDALIACFDTGINKEFVKKLAAQKPLRVVFRDNGFASNDGSSDDGSSDDGSSDDVKANVMQIFRQLSPNTDIKVI